MVVIGEGTAPRRVGRRESSGTVPVTRITVIDADPLFDDATAAEWLRDRLAVPDFGPAILERLVTSFRVASADPLLADIDLSRAFRTRVGYGSGEQVAEGAWTDAIEIEPARRGLSRAQKRDQHRPTDRLAALLAGRDVILASEELVLRARLDLDRMRAREAALQLDAALSCACAELEGWRSVGDLSKRLVELESYLAPVAAAAAAAREGTLDPRAIADVKTALDALEAALRARAIYSAEGR